MSETYRQASEAEAEEACTYLRAIIEAAENSNQAGEDAVVRAAAADRLESNCVRSWRGQPRSFWATLESGTLIRDISKDHEPGWAVKMMQFVDDLRKLQEAICKAEGGTDE